MFSHCTSTKTQRSAAAVTADTDVDFGRCQVPDSSGYMIQFDVVRSAGSLAVTLLGSFNGTTYFALPAALNATLNLTGTRYIDLAAAEALPPYLRVRMIRAGFTGTVAVATRSNLPQG